MKMNMSKKPVNILRPKSGYRRLERKSILHAFQKLQPWNKQPKREIEREREREREITHLYGGLQLFTCPGTFTSHHVNVLRFIFIRKWESTVVMIYGILS